MPEPQLLLGGLIFPEGPRWRDGRLWFSEMHGDRRGVWTVTPSGQAEFVVHVPGDPSGIGWLPDGRLLVVEMKAARVLRLENGALVPHADLAAIDPNEWNDMVVDAAGNAYVGGFGFNFRGGEQPRPTSIVRVTPYGQAQVAATGLMFPNGMVITPDGRRLIVGETFGRRLTAFEIAPDGSLTNRQEFASTHPAFPDGICLDVEGAVWVASPPTREFLRVREGGEIAERISLENRMAIACMLGGEDRRTLFLLTAAGTNEDMNNGTTRGAIATVRVDVPGAGWP